MVVIAQAKQKTDRVKLSLGDLVDDEVKRRTCQTAKDQVREVCFHL